ncbi:type II secretion system F family protein [Sediminivirga luteola]|jgi:tight adherence protein C|uniref:Membrane protein n=1 Tax=Sediminivirga luteola TaxID=1774748 RepID=A0A8J2TXP0_9MICO|nr:type II secretion system F family protein [Sediminivirga luteola]MCI2266054.1 type II secretion system F family protein [Sediminivirga luteola]GGA13436.1 membrane protein [Sediminivirga luteola]
MAALLFGLVAALILLFAIRGFVLVRSDPLGHLAQEDRALIKDSAQRRRRESLLTRFGRRFGPEVAGLAGPGYRDLIARQVLYAQDPQFPTIGDFFAMKARLLLICGLGAIGLGLMLQSPYLPLLLLAIGFFVPDLALISGGRKRQAAIEDALPDFLDILAVTVSAGLSFRGALQRVTERTEGPLAEEMRTAMRQMDVGTSRYEAFRALRERTQSPSMDAFITSMLQAEELGSPLVDALEQIALDMRRARAQKARQEASKASPKIAGVVTIVMVPGTMVLIIVSMYFVAGLDFGELFGSAP